MQYSFGNGIATMLLINQNLHVSCAAEKAIDMEGSELGIDCK